MGLHRNWSPDSNYGADSIEKPQFADQALSNCDRYHIRARFIHISTDLFHSMKMRICESPFTAGRSIKQSHWATDAGGMNRAIPAGVLREVLLVVVLGVEEIAKRGYFGCDL